MLAENHLITSPHTLEHWPNELYLTDPVIDRLNRENWEERGSKGLYARACEQVDKALLDYKPIATDPKIDSAMREIIISGLNEQTKLPEIPSVAQASEVPKTATTRRRGNRRRVS